MFFLAGCATNVNKIASNPDKATIIAYSDSAANVFLPLSSTKSTRIEKVNGKKVSDFFTETDVITLEAGTHLVAISCHIIQGGINVSNQTLHKLIVEKGKQYIFKAFLDSSYGCKTSYEII